MVLPGHLSGGFLTTFGLISLVHPDFSNNQIIVLYIIGTLSGDFPDIDLLFFNLKYKKDKLNHRDYITHTPLFWLLISLIIFVTGISFNNKFIEFVSLIILAGTFSHLIFDSIEYGIRWFFPFSNKRFSIIKKMPNETTDDKPGSIIQYFHFITKTYWKTITIWCELIITAIAILFFIKNF